MAQAFPLSALSAQHSAWQGAGPSQTFTESTPLLKGEGKHRGIKELLFPMGLGLGRERYTRRPGKWKAPPLPHSEHLHPEEGSKQVPELLLLFL